MAGAGVVLTTDDVGALEAAFGADSVLYDAVLQSLLA